MEAKARAVPLVDVEGAVVARVVSGEGKEADRLVAADSEWAAAAETAQATAVGMLGLAELVAVKLVEVASGQVAVVEKAPEMVAATRVVECQVAEL